MQESAEDPGGPRPWVLPPSSGSPPWSSGDTRDQALSTPRGPRPTYLCVLAKGAKSHGQGSRQARWGLALTTTLVPS